MQKNIPTVTSNMDNATNTPLPSYAEAIGLPASTSNNSYILASNYPASYGQEYSQMPSYAPTAPNYVHSNIPNQPPYHLQSNPIANNPTYVSTFNQQSQPANGLYVARTRVIARTENRKYRQCIRVGKIVFCMITIFVVIVIILNIVHKL